MMQGIPGFFPTNLHAMGCADRRRRRRGASYYTTRPLRETLAALVDFAYLCNAVRA